MLEDGDTMIHLSKSYFALMDGKFIVEGRMSWAALEPIRTGMRVRKMDLIDRPC